LKLGISRATPLGLRSKTNMAFSLALVALATIAFFSIRESRSLADKDRWVSQTRDVLELSGQLTIHIAEAAGARATYIRSGDEAQFAALTRASDLVIENFAALRRMIQNPDQLRRLAKMEPLLRGRLSLLKDAMESHRRNPNDQRDQNIVTAQGAVLMADFLDLAHEFDGVERDLLQQGSTDAGASGRRATKINLILNVFVLSFLILTLWFLNIGLSRREKAELDAVEQKKLLQSILDCCSDSVTVADSSGKIILRNPTSLRDVGNARIEVLDKDYPRLVGLYKGDGDTLFKTEELPLIRALRGESVNGLEIYIRFPNGAEPKWMLAAGGPLVNDKGEKLGGVVFLRDITDRKKADKQLSVALQESELQAKENIELSELGDLLQSCHNVQEAYMLSENILAHMFAPRPGALCLINSSRDLVEVAASWNECSTTESVFSPEDCWGLRRGKPYGSLGSGAPLRCSHVNEAVKGEYLCVPLIAQGETLGLLYIEDQPALPASSPEARQDQQLILKRRVIAVAERVSLALANLRLRELLRNQSIRDPLTGLFNRRYLEESLNREIHRASRAGRYVSLAMLDLDHFKHFNDTFGHQAGDILLKEVASAISSRVRAGDLACRYGGEEFSIIIAEVDMDGAYKCVESIRETIKHLSLNHRGQTLGTITISAGIASFPVHGDNANDLIHAADKALYTAKKEGRDRIVVAATSENRSKSAQEIVES
jgi:diguanylate cyclase (GGDEF)-like protein/PAS domain S-box-containing protein